MRARRFLPNLSLLLAFDAVMREGSVTGAATELSLTQSTVSRLIQTLEAQLGVTLFLREKKRLRPTDAARRYAPQISDALDRIQTASMGLVVNPDGGVIELAVLPTFATRWLAPRLPQFLAANPGITLNMTTRLRPLPFDQTGADLMIYYGDETWPDANRQKIFDEALTACASPTLLQSRPISRLQDLEGHTLLQMASRPKAWSAWAKGQKGGNDAMPATVSMQMDQFSLMIQTAVSGLGVALLPAFLAAAEIAEGRLLPVLQADVAGSGAYWLAWPKRLDSAKPLVSFRKWLQTEQV